VSVTGAALEVDYGATGPGEVRLLEDSDNGSNYMGFKAPSAVTSNLSLELPNGDGTADYAMVTDGAGVLSWADVLHADTTNVLTAGYTQTSNNIGNSGTGTITPAISSGTVQHMTINGSFTLAAPTDTDEGYIEIEATNDGTGGYTLSTSGFSTLSGTYADTASALNIFRISKHNTNVYLEIINV
jgi:hypothetical protein